MVLWLPVISSEFKLLLFGRCSRFGWTRGPVGQLPQDARISGDAGEAREGHSCESREW